MALPETVRVKLSSEAAEAISLTPVLIQQIPIRELIEHMLGVAGKNEPRIREILQRGTLVAGASRFRWTGWEADAADLAPVLATFPDPDPARVFQPARCVRALLRGGARVIDLPRAVGARKSWFRRASFWDGLMEVAGAGALRYNGYSYRDRADRYTRDLTPEETARVRTAGGLLHYSTMRDQLRLVAFTSIELYAER
jgi:hypothetical protein